MKAIILFCGYFVTVFLRLLNHTVSSQNSEAAVDLFVITVSSMLLAYWSMAVAKLLVQRKNEERIDLQ